MKKTVVLLLMLILLISMAFALGSKKVEPPGVVAGQTESAELYGAAVEGLDAAVSAAEEVPAIELQESGNKNQETISAIEAETAGEPPGGHISPAIDGMVTVTIIPLLVLIAGLFWKSFDKNRLTQLLLNLWGLIKDADNFFAFPNAEQQRLIEDNGMNAAKKIWVAEQAIKAFKPNDVTYLKKKTGSIGNAIELAINVFKFGSTVFGVGKKLVNVFK